MPPVPKDPTMPALAAILETSLYVDDLDRAAAFYEGVMGLAALHTDSRLRAYAVHGRSVLLLFIRGGTLAPVKTPGGTIPPHDGAGQLHIAFSITMATLAEWEDHLARHSVAIEGRSDWARGGHSLYFRDPDQNLLELAAGPGLWAGF